MKTNKLNSRHFLYPFFLSLRFFLLFVSLFCFLPLFLPSFSYSTPPDSFFLYPPTVESEYRQSLGLIPHSFIIYLGPKGQKFFETGLQDLLYANGINFEQFEENDFSYSTGEKPLLELLPHEDLAELFAKVKDFFNSFLVGAKFSSAHDLALEIQNLYLESSTQDIGVRFSLDPLNTLPIQDSSNFSSEVLLHLNLSIKSFLIDLNSLLVRDKLHAFLGEAGLSHLQLYLDEIDGPLNFHFVFTLRSEGRHLSAHFTSLESNLDELNLHLSYGTPLILPSFSLNLGEGHFTFNQEALTLFLEENHDKILSHIKDLFHKEMHALLPLAENFVNSILEDFGENPHVNDMAPPAAPENSPPYKWGLLFSSLKAENNDIKVVFDAFLEDPLSSPDVPNALASYYNNYLAKKEIELKSDMTKDFDLTLAINQGLFNRLFYHNFVRNYFANMSFSDKILSLDRPPIIELGNCAQSGPVGQTLCYPYLDVGLGYPLSRVQAIAFNANPFYAKARLYIDFSLGQSGVGVKIRNFDSKSVQYDTKQIKYGLGWIVEPILEGILKDIEKKLQNFSLVDGLPLPTSIWGLAFEIKKISVDRDGYLVVSIDFKKEEI